MTAERKYQGLASVSLREMKEYAKLDPEGLVYTINEGLSRKDNRPEDFSIAHLAESLIPAFNELKQDYRSGQGFGSSALQLFQQSGHLLEAGPVKASQFLAISGQIVYSKVLEYYEAEEFTFTKEIPEWPSPFQNTTEKVAGISKLGNDIGVVAEGDEYPTAGPVEDYIELPAASKRGERVQLTWEAVFNDRTGDLLKRSADVGYVHGYAKETRAIDSIVDENTGAKSILTGGHRYHWRGTSYATYQATSPWDNVTATNALVDWTNIQNAELTLSRIVDPNTGLTILIQPDTVMVTKQLEYTARYVIQATSLAVNAGGYNASTTVTRHELANFLPKYRILTSRLLETRMATDTSWLLGNLKKLVANKMCRPMKVDSAPDTHPDNFDREIINQWKVSEVSNFVVVDPRMMTESTVA